MDTLNLADLVTRTIEDADARIGSVSVLIPGRTGSARAPGSTPCSTADSRRQEAQLTVLGWSD